MAAFDVEYIGERTRQVRLADLVITATTERRGSRPKVTVTQAESLLWGDRVDLADPNARRKLRRRMKKHGVDVPEPALLALTVDPQPEDRPVTDPAEAYRATAEGFVHRTIKNGTLHERRISNFTAVIEKERILDDGDNRQREYQLRVAIGSVVQHVRLPATQLANVLWIPDQLGAKAILSPGIAGADHLRAAIQVNSPAVIEERVYTHTGWRLHEGKHVYLHGGGAIDTGGLRTDIQVQLPAALARYNLPDPPQGQDLADAVRADLRFLDVAPDRITVPLLATVYRAVLGPCETTVHLVGQTGVFKTELAAVVLQRFGKDMDARHLPASWESTAAYVGVLQFLAKDALLVVDDYVPSGTIHDVQRSNRDMARVVRGQGNAAGRGRARPDGSARQVRPPRGSLLSTGEDIPAGHSLRARMLAVEVVPGDVDIQRLTACQHDASAGLYVATLSAVFKWLAANYGLVEGVRDRVKDLRAQVPPSALPHARTPETVADLAVGVETLLAFAVEAEILTGDEADRLMCGRVWPALLEAAERQAGHQRADDPAARFIELVRAGVTSGKAHVTTMSGQAPADCRTWGWQTEADQRFDNGEWQAVERARPQGRHIGWIEGQDVYLQPDAAYTVVQEAARDGQRVLVSPRTLHVRLKEKGILASVDDARGTATIRKVIDGHRHEVLHLKAATIFEAVTRFP